MKSKMYFRVARVNSFGVIEGQTSPMAKREAERMAERNNIAAAAAGDSARYVATAYIASQPTTASDLADRLRTDADVEQKKSAKAETDIDHAYHRGRADALRECAKWLDGLVAIGALEGGV